MKRKSRSDRPRASRGALSVVAVLLISSGLVRLGAGSGEAIAREVANLEPAAAKAPAAAECTSTEDVALALKALAEREGRIAEREREIEERSAILAEAEAAMEETMAELAAAEERLSETVSFAHTAAENDLERLTKVYEAMKPKVASALFEQMDPSFAAGFLGRMRAEAAAQIMAGLPPETAYTISVVLAARNADIPKQ